MINLAIYSLEKGPKKPTLWLLVGGGGPSKAGPVTGRRGHSATNSLLATISQCECATVVMLSNPSPGPLKTWWISSMVISHWMHHGPRLSRITRSMSTRHQWNIWPLGWISLGLTSHGSVGMWHMWCFWELATIWQPVSFTIWFLGQSKEDVWISSDYMPTCFRYPKRSDYFRYPILFINDQIICLLILDTPLYS